MGNRKRIIIIAATVVLLQILYICYVFVYEKEGQHSDELWGYGLANSYYEPYIFMSADTGETTYENEWVSGQVFNDYITVSEEECFSYGSVISNLKKDTAPPLFSLLLHTVSSFFPEQYSPWFGFAINLVAFGFLQLFLFMLAKKLSDSDFIALLAIILYGFSVGGVSTAIFVRHYMLLTLFAVMTMYFHFMALKAEDRREKIIVFSGLVISVAGGALSHYFYIVFLAGFAVLYIIYFLLKKQWKQAGVYATAVFAPLIASTFLSN
ncbi:MAG: glycosyltransferase family 39 protein, partial [Lachnospiraceae bacterium]